MEEVCLSVCLLTRTKPGTQRHPGERASLGQWTGEEQRPGAPGEPDAPLRRDPGQATGSALRPGTAAGAERRSWGPALALQPEFGSQQQRASLGPLGAAESGEEAGAAGPGAVGTNRKDARPVMFITCLQAPVYRHFPQLQCENMLASHTRSMHLT